jgi:hypothetical protein
LIPLPLYLTVDVTPGLVSDATSYFNSDLAGLNIELERVGYGTMYPGVDYSLIDAGGFALIKANDVFQPNERLVVRYFSTAQIPTVSNSRYSNGFDITPVLSSLTKRLGWRQPTLAGSPVLNSDNLQSTSGRYFQSFHSLVTIAKIKDVCEDKDISDADFNTYLTNLQQDAIMRCLNEVFREPELIEQKLLYTRFATMDQPIENSGLFTGYIINVANDFGISTQINSATLYFDQDCTFNLYLFQDGVKLPLQTINVSCVAFQRTVVEFDNLVLNFKTGQKYYFGYFQSELGAARAIREQVETWATTRCFEAFVFQAPAIGNTDFNHNYRQYGFLPMGVNLEMISFKDHTQKILRKANLFDEVVGLQVAAMVIEEIVMTTRTNKDERQIGEIAGKIYAELNQAYATEVVPIMPGLKSRIAGELKRLRLTFFPEQKPMSISMENDYFGIESTWYKQNYRQITNPPMQVQ